MAPAISSLKDTRTSIEASKCFPQPTIISQSTAKHYWIPLPPIRIRTDIIYLLLHTIQSRDSHVRQHLFDSKVSSQLVYSHLLLCEAMRC
ncbi:hypothetical protein E2C01_085234 [Portunus trituberculatus]|uniref:Uncharacterized protein n=1 Tax=Portunus trituberculatus TaxID=210409 RepID=A0A5B7JBD3_PORTR|nr:hypothetical protein [Portunus trituberculatus]